MTATLTRPIGTSLTTAVVDSPEWIWTEFEGDIVPREDADFFGDYRADLAAAAARMIATALPAAWAARGYTEVVAVPASVFGTLDEADDLAGLHLANDSDYFAVWAEVADAIEYLDVVEAADLVAEYRAAA